MGSMPASVIPVLGHASRTNIPCMGVGYRQTRGMRARAILSKNLRTLIEAARQADPRLGAIRKVAEASGGKLTNGTVGRIAAGTHTTDIDTLADLAEVFGLQPWQLLVEDLNPKVLPHLVDAEFLSRIKQIVDGAQATNAAISPSPMDELTVQKEERNRPVVVGPALQDAFNSGKKNNAVGRLAKATKPKGRRSS